MVGTVPHVTVCLVTFMNPSSGNFFEAVVAFGCAMLPKLCRPSLVFSLTPVAAQLNLN
jgi:hypothetical protein